MHLYVLSVRSGQIATIGDRTFPAAAASVWNSLLESVRASPSLQVFSQQTEDRAFCPVVQLFWLRASHCTDYHVTSLLFLRVTCPCSLRTYATLKFIRSSSSPSNQVFIIQLLSVIAASATNSLHCSLSSAMLYTVILCLPDVLPNWVTLASLRSSSTHSIRLFSGFPLDLFPLGCHW